MVQDLYVLMITAAVVSILFKLLKQPVVLGYIVAGVLVGPYLFGKSLVNPDNVKQWGWQEPCESGQREAMGRHRCAVCVVLHRFGVPPEESHQQRQGGSNRCVDNHRRHDALWLPCGSGC